MYSERDSLRYSKGESLRHSRGACTVERNSLMHSKGN